MTANAQPKEQDPIAAFERERAEAVAAQGRDADLRAASAKWMELSIGSRYSYGFTALGRPIIQYPQDIVAMQELIWAVKPDLIIETGIAHGGSLILSASQLALLDYCEAAEKGEVLDPAKPKRRVLGIDIDIRAHNRAAVEAHPLASRIDMIEGSSIAPEVVKQAAAAAHKAEKVLVCLDSNHTHAHVLAELEAYAPLVSVGSYCIVFDTVVEDLPKKFYENRPWGPGDNPKTAAREYLAALSGEGRTAADGKPLRFEIDRETEDRILLTVAPEGFLKRI